MAVEQTTSKLRAAMVAERRHSSQIAGMEAVSHLLASVGPTPEMLDRALGVLVDRFRYTYVSIYLAENDRLRLGAQRGYQQPPDSFDEAMTRVIATWRRSLKGEHRSVAAIMFDDEAEPTREQLLRTADVALFMAKRAGRNRVVAA